MQRTQTPHILKIFAFRHFCKWLASDFHFYNLCTKHIAKREILDTSDKASLYLFPLQIKPLWPGPAHSTEQVHQGGGFCPIRDQQMLRGKAGQLGTAAGGMRSVGRQHTQPCLQCSCRLPPLPSQRMWARTLRIFWYCWERATYFPDFFSPVHR